jgi:SET domain-containing protein
MQEEVFSGLLGGSLPYELELVEVEGKGRGVRVKEKVPKGAYVCEYEGEVYPRKERAAREREYAVNGEGCYILDCQTREGWICIDATRSYSAIGRLLNHAPSFLATLVPYKPLLVNGQWRVGFVASKNLMPGDELLWDYGCEPGGEEWLMQRRRATDISVKESALEFFDTEARELHVGRVDAEEQWEEDDKEEERSEGESSGDEDEEERMALGEHTQGESAISKDCNKGECTN